MHISLIREHSEKNRTPRTLWVTFELGRPLGVPNDADFQRRVVKAALKLLESTNGPILADYPEDAPAARDRGDDEEPWVCPISLGPPSDTPGDESMDAKISREMARLAPWHDLAVRKMERSTVGSSGLEMPDAAAFVLSFLSGEIPESPIDGARVDRALKWACDDIKAYYYEAMLAQPGAPTSGDLDAWFFGETTAGSVFFDLQKVLLRNADETFQLIGKQYLVPRLQQHWSPLG